MDVLNQKDAPAPKKDQTKPSTSVDEINPGALDPPAAAPPMTRVGGGPSARRGSDPEDNLTNGGYHPEDCSLQFFQFLTQYGTFIAQMLFSLIGVIFACAMLWRGEDSGTYLPVLTGIIGYWVPSPKSSSKKKTL